MHPTKIFISYPRTVAGDVRGLADQLARLGQDVWLDQELNGGQEWWDTILERIRACDCFMFALCEPALQSKACRAELEYAHEAQRTILPMSIGAAVPDQLLPRYLSRLQRVNADDPTQVARALLHLADPKPLPSPLPTPPPVPISYLDELAEVVERPDLPLADQNNLLATLRQRLAHGEDRDAALTLLRRLRRRSDVYAGVADEIDAELARHAVASRRDRDDEGRSRTTPDHPDPIEGSRTPPGEDGTVGHPPPPRTPPPPPPTAPPAPPTPTPAPGPPARSRRTGILAGIAAGVLVIGGVGAAIGLSGGGGGGSDPSPDPPDDPPYSYGDDPHLDGLDDGCSSGDLDDCDLLYADSPSGSEYEAYGATCGDISFFPMDGSCASEFDSDLDAATRSCDAGDMAACDTLYVASPAGSVYEEFGSYCGSYSDEPLTGSCEATLGA